MGSCCSSPSHKDSDVETTKKGGQKQVGAINSSNIIDYAAENAVLTYGNLGDLSMRGDDMEGNLEHKEMVEIGRNKRYKGTWNSENQMHGFGIMVFPDGGLY